MPYLTSWDINVFLCLLYLGVPDDVIKIAIKITKKTHEEYSLGEAMTYWVLNSPSLVKQDVSHLFAPTRQQLFKLFVNNDNDRGETRINVCKNRYNLTKDFKGEWRYRSIEERKKKVVDWCKFGNIGEQYRHHRRLSKGTVIADRQTDETRAQWIERYTRSNEVIDNYVKNLWSTWEAYASSYYFVGWDRRAHVSEWYEGIHPGRFFLFYKENKIIEERHRGVPSGPCEDGYVYPRTSIFDWGPYEQLIEDLRCIDGPGIGETVGNTIEHIDDLFI